MKKYLLLLASAALLLVGCAKEKFTEPIDGGLTKATFSVSVDNGVATRAVADGDGAGAYVNRCIMEIYFQNELYKRMEAAMSETPATATFANVPVVAGKEYQILFWADCGGDGQIDKYYTTKTDTNNKGLKAVTVNGTAFKGALETGKNDELDAFYAAQNYTVSQTGDNAFTIKLHRPFAQLNVITTDVAAGKTVINADLLPEKVSVSYTAATTFNVADSTVTGSATYEYEAPVYGGKTDWGTVKTRGEFTLSMDYILAAKDKGAIDVTFKTKNGENVVMTHNLTNLPYKRNYRTNVKGDLLTTGGTWKATIEPKWGNGTDTGEIDHKIATSYTEVKTALQSGDKSDNLKVTVTPAAVNNLSDEEKAQVIVDETIDGTSVKALKFVLYEEKTTGPDAHPASPDHVEFELPECPTGVQAWKIEHETNYPTQTVVVSTKADNDANIIIEAPKSTVTLEAAKINSVVSTTSENTLIIPQGLQLTNLEVKKGAVEYHGEGLEKVTVNALEGAKVYFKTSEGLANTPDVYEVVKNYVAPGYAITKESETTWKIVPAVCKIDEIGYGTLADAVAKVQEGQTITLVKDVENAVGIAINTAKTFTIDFNNHKYIVNKPGAGSTGTQTAAFQLIKGQTITFKNGIIKAAEDNLAEAVAPAKNIKRMFQSYANVTFEDMTIDGTNIYGNNSVCEFACGAVNINGTTSITTGKQGVAAINVDTWKDYYPEGAQVAISSTGEFGDVYLYAEENAAQFTKSSLTITNGKFSKVYGDDSGDWTASISGGVFSEKPDASLIAEHFDAVANTDPATSAKYPFTVKVKPVVKIGNVEYADIADAFAAVPTTGTPTTVTLLENIGSKVGNEITWKEYAKTSVYKIKDGQNITFDLNGHKLYAKTTVDGYTCFFEVVNGGSLTFMDSVGGGELNYLDGKDNTGGLAIISYGKLIMQSGTVENHTKCNSSAIQGAIDVRANEWGAQYEHHSVFTMNGGVLKSNGDNTLRIYDSSQTGTGSVVVDFTINGGEVYGADAIFIQPAWTKTYSAYDIYMNNFNISVTGGKFDTNNGIRVYGAVNETNNQTYRAIQISVTGGEFTIRKPSDKYRDGHIAYQNNGTSTDEATVFLRSYTEVNWSANPPTYCQE